MTPEGAAGILYTTLTLVLKIGAPMLIAGLVVGLAVGIIQAATQVNEMTVTFVAKLLAMGGVFILIMPWAISQMLSFTRSIMGLVAAGPG